MQLEFNFINFLQEKTMKTNMLTRVRRLYPDDRYLARQWVRSVRMLGDRWLLAKPMDRDVLKEMAAKRYA